MTALGPLLVLALIVLFMAGGFLLPLLWYLAAALAVIWIVWWIIDYTGRRRQLR